MPSPSSASSSSTFSFSLIWDIRYTAQDPRSSIPDWRPTAWTRTPLQRLKFLQTDKQKADAILRAARVLSGEIPQQWLIRETDNVGREAKLHYVDKGGFKGFRLQAVKREGRWEATVWPGHEDLGWPEGRVAGGRTLEECLREVQVMIRDKWSIKAGRNIDVGAGNKLMGSFG